MPEVIAAIRATGGGILADEMGLGKTVQAVAALAMLHVSGRLAARPRVLVVAPATVLRQWRAEVVRWYPVLRARILHPSAGTTGDVDSADCDIGLDDVQESILPQDGPGDSPEVFITTYEQLGTRAAGKAILRTPYALVFLDEGHRVRNPETRAARLVRRLDAAARIERQTRKPGWVRFTRTPDRKPSASVETAAETPAEIVAILPAEAILRLSPLAGLTVSLGAAAVVAASRDPLSPANRATALAQDLADLRTGAWADLDDDIAGRLNVAGSPAARADAAALAAARRAGVTYVGLRFTVASASARDVATTADEGTTSTVAMRPRWCRIVALMP